MVLCKFFLQGNCRFGENCKFEHQLNDNRQQHSSIIRQQNFTANTSNTNVDTNTLIRAVTNDMMTAEKGGQWLLSCYAPFKEKPNFPGFEEQSFEEVRWGYYEAQRNGNVDQFNQQLQMALQAAAMKIRSLQNPSPDAVNTIKTIYNTTPNPSASTNNMFGNSNFTNAPANPYGQSNYGNQFAQNAQQQNAASKSIFAVANQKLFGPQQHSNSIFGGQPGQSIFANAPMSGGDTFNQAQPFANQSPFGMQPNLQNVAYGSQPFVQQQQQQTFDMQQQNASPFGVAQPQTNSPLFTGGGQQQNAPFSTQPQAAAAQQLFPSPFTAQPIALQQPFAPQQQFAAQPPATTNTPFAPSTTNIFSGTSSMHSVHPSQSVMFASGAGQDQSAYSKLEELSESDIKAYESDNFEFGKIPEKPPTIQMCF